MIHMLKQPLQVHSYLRKPNNTIIPVPYGSGIIILRHDFLKLNYAGVFILSV